MTRRAIIACALWIFASAASCSAQAPLEITFGMTSNTAFGLAHYIAPIFVRTRWRVPATSGRATYDPKVFGRRALGGCGTRSIPFTARYAVGHARTKSFAMTY